VGDVLEASEEHVVADGGLELDMEDDGAALVAEGDPPCGVDAPELGPAYGPAPAGKPVPSSYGSGSVRYPNWLS